MYWHVIIIIFPLAPVPIWREDTATDSAAGVEVIGAPSAAAAFAAAAPLSLEIT